MRCGEPVAVAINDCHWFVMIAHLYWFVMIAHLSQGMKKQLENTARVFASTIEIRGPGVVRFHLFDRLR